MLLTLRGTPFLYYGEEIGMRDIRLRRSEILDPIGKKYWPIYKGRDGCRAPMQWNTDTNSGFSSVKPWLPVHPDFPQRNVETQSQDSRSLLRFYKEMLAFRSAQPALISGDFQSLKMKSPHVLAYKRVHADQTILVLLNFGGNPQEIALPDESTYLLGLSSTGRKPGKIDGSSFNLRADEVLILIKD